MNITLIGTGVYGLAIASALAKNKHKIVMWTESNEKYEEYLKTRNLKSICDFYNLPNNIIITKSLEDALNKTQMIFLTCASKYVEETIKKIKPLYKENTPICIASKGIEENTSELLSTIVKKTLNTKKVAVISGPTFAVDMLKNEPVALAIASIDKNTKYQVADALKNNTLKLRISKDIIGIQICGSVKNIIAIASGILGGLGYSESTQAFLINESLHDIKKLITFLGGRPKTILSFAGVGDLLMTSMSKKSRNYSFGYVIGSSTDKSEVKKFLDTHTVEGFTTLKTIINLLKRKNINIELIYLINDIVEGKKNPHELADFLINKK